VHCRYPKSRLSAVYQIILGFIVLIIVAAYTANLAAFLQAQSYATFSATSVDQVLFSAPPISIPNPHPRAQPHPALNPHPSIR
jgi:hypothetical protein